MRTFATMFSGFGGADIGFEAAGLESLWGLEYDDDIASVARSNGLPIRTADVTTQDYSELEVPDLLHMSPECKSFSVAKASRKELKHDRECAEGCVRAIETLKPQYVTVENVWGYRNSESWQIIHGALKRYDVAAWHINMADYGVPQTRKRMIAVARRGGPLPTKPSRTHAEGDESDLGGLFGAEGLLPEWVGWHEAIVDLISDLPNTEFADWQKKRLPEEVKTFLYMGQQNSNGAGVLETKKPAWTIAAQPAGGNVRAFVASGCLNSNSTSMTTRDGHAPHMTVTTSPNQKDLTAYSQGRVVRMTPRCLARFQSFPDSYELPESRRLACKGIGNAVPPLFMQRLAEHLLR